MRYVLFVFTLLFCLQTGAQRNPNDKLKIVELSGTPFERGVQHGRQLKTEIAELMVLWKKSLASNARMPADTFIRNFLAATNFIPTITLLTPGILAEVKGIAEGAGQSFDDMLAFQLVDEYWIYTDRMHNDVDFHHCSAVGASSTKERAAFVSQNIDLESWMNGYQTLLHLAADSTTPEQYIITCAGLIALSGANAGGVGVCVNSLMQLQASTDGLPVAFIIRGLLERTDRQDVLKFLQSTKHASGQNYLLGIADTAYDFEASATKVLRVMPSPSGMLYHTNHPLVNDDVKPWYRKYYERFTKGETQAYNSEVRLKTLSNRLENNKVTNVEPVKATLQSTDDKRNPVCRGYDPSNNGFTFSSVIFTLSDKRSVQLTVGPPNQSNYQVFTFRK